MELKESLLINLYNELTEYSKQDWYPYHMPGHKRQEVSGLPKELRNLDITEIDGFDNLHDASSILLQLQKEAARLFHAKETFFLINGSTSGILKTISASVPLKRPILSARNCDQAVYHAS